MDTQQDSRTPPRILTSKPSVAFSTQSAGSATSAGTPQSGGSRLLFGEIDTSSERSESFASVCSLVLADNSLFTRFWLTDTCREGLISILPRPDLANLRLVCHDFAVRAAPTLFADLVITFRTNTFSKPSRLAALQRLGFHTKTLAFNIPHTPETFLPPLIEPDTGEELSFTYTPRIRPPALREPKYGDADTTEILTRQWPPLFHAATNVHSFIQAFSAFINLSHLKIACPHHDSTTRLRRSTVDFALISLRIAIERNCLNALHSLTLSPVHPGALHYLSPLSGYGATPASLRKWIRIQHLTICAAAISSEQVDNQADQLSLLQAYLAIFRRNLQTFVFTWNQRRGPLPLNVPVQSSNHTPGKLHPALLPPNSSEETIRPQPVKKLKRRPSAALYPALKHLEIENATATATDISAVIALHKSTLENLDFRDITLTSGTWEQAFAPLTKMAEKSRGHVTELADIPIMLSPSAAQTFPRLMVQSKAVPQSKTQPVRRSFRASRWLGARRLGNLTPKTPLLSPPSAGVATKLVKRSLHDCEAQVKKVFKGRVFAWI